MRTLGEEIGQASYAPTLGEEITGKYDSDNDLDFPGMEDLYDSGESVRDEYRGNATDDKAGYKSETQRKQETAKPEETEFDKIVKEETKKIDEKDDEVRKTTTSAYAEHIDLEEIRRELEETKDNKNSKEEAIKKELEDAIKSEQLTRM